jgi:hypothetical protein
VRGGVVGDGEVPGVRSSREGARGGRLSRGIAHGLARRESQRGDRRLLVAVDAEALLDRVVGLVARRAWSDECMREARGRRGRRQRSGDGQQQPGEDDEASMVKHGARE